MVAVALGAAAVVGAGASAYSANKSADAQKKSAALATQTQQQQYQQTRSDLAPYRTAGSNALTELNALYGLSGTDAQAAAMGRFREDPGAAYARQRAVDSVTASNAAHGIGLSGGTLAGITDRTFNLADQNYNQYLARLQALTSNGQNAAAQTGSFGANAANNIAGNQLAAGQATAGAYINGANSFNNMLSNLSTTYGAYKGGAFGGGGNPYSQYLPQTAQSIFG